MASFERGETVTLELLTKNRKTLVLSDPATGITVEVWDSAGALVVNGTAMVKDAVGEYHLYYTLPAQAPLGVYQVLYTVADGANITKQRDSFTVHK